MSTDYGFKCRDCNVVCEIDNFSHYRASELQAFLEGWLKIKAVRDLGLRVSFADGDYYIEGACEFLDLHLGRGHCVVVADEYGRELESCGKWLACAECGTRSAHCKLAPGHAGGCLARAP